jgi:peptidoglycan/LPS O-acetylase OafA/YrhL
MKKTEGRVAVLAVVIAGVIALMVEKGPYTWGNTVFGLTLIVPLVAYGAPRRDEEKDDEEDLRPPVRYVAERAAFGAALSLCIMNILGPILNWLILDPVEFFYRVRIWEVQVLRDLPFLAVWVFFAIVGYCLAPKLYKLVHKHPTSDNTDRLERD